MNRVGVVGLSLATYMISLMVFLQRHDFAVGALIHVDNNFTSIPSALENVPVSSKGYDGQFFYRLALDPLYKDPSLEPRLDAPAYRQQRILYPLLVWAFSFGNKAIVPAVMVAVNLVFVCFLAWLGAEYAMHLGRSPVWGLLLSFYPGFLFSFLHDLPEAMAASLLVGGLLAIRVGRPLLASLGLGLGVLTRETSVLMPLAISAVLVWHILQEGHSLENQHGRKVHWFSGVLPIALFVLWQMAISLRWGHTPFAEASGNVGLPLFGFSLTAWKLLPPLEKVVDIFDLGLLLGFLLIGVLVVMEFKSRSILSHEKVAIVFYAFFASLFTTSIWEYRGGFLRALSEYYLLGFPFIVSSKLQFSKFLFGYWTLAYLGSAIGYTLL